MTEPPASSRCGAKGRRRSVLLVVTGLAITITVVAMAWFQPWKLWVDSTVDEAAPVGAVIITVPAIVAPSTAPTPSPPPTTASPGSAQITPPPSSTPAVAAAPPAVTTAPATTAPSTTAPPPTAAGGPFIGIDHDTSGSVALLQDPSGAQFVRIEELDTSNGPDLFVYLSTNPPDGEEDQFDDDIVNLGRLQGNVGSSNYAIPTGTDVGRYASIVIWCDRFNSAFGAASLV
jgi:hypothetical protein